MGRYREIASIGQGGMAKVTLAALQGPALFQKLLVIKEIIPQHSGDPEYVAMFMDEARLAARLEHPNLIQTYEVCEEEGRRFFVMEYLEGQSYSALLSRLRRAVPLPVALRVLTRVLAGLHYAHELTDLDGSPLGVVHRDVTPHNVLLGYGGAIKLVDFGIAKAIGADAKTKTGVFKGKVSYAAPEQFEGLPVDRRADVFAAGVLLWEALVGRRITHGLDDMAIMHRRVVGADPKALEENPEAPADLAAICDRAMARSRSDRYATAREMENALEAAMEKAGMRATDEEVGALVTQTFQTERSTVRKLIQERLSQPEAAEPLPLFTGAPQSGSLSEDRSGSEPAATPLAERSHAATVLDTNARQRKSLRRVVAVALAAAAAVTVAVVMMMAFGVGRSAPPAVGGSVAPPPASAQPAPPASAAADVDVYFAAQPPAAHFTLDGVALEGNPYERRMARDQEAHTLTVSAPGFVADQRAVTLDRDLHLELALAPSATAPPTGAPTTTRPVGTGKTPGTKPHQAGAIDSSDPYAGGLR